MAEVHIIGQIHSAYDFPTSRLFCRWKIVAGNSWKWVAGHTDGQTQVDCPKYENVAYFSHPLDIHYSIRGLQGWPKMQLEVWSQDEYGRIDLQGYGVCHLPTSPGHQKVLCHTWRPIGSFRDVMTQAFLGGSARLRDPDNALSTSERYRLKTLSTGTVELSIFIITRNFDKFGIEY